jgi:hypothetical protein
MNRPVYQNEFKATLDVIFSIQKRVAVLEAAVKKIAAVSKTKKKAS